MSNIHTECPREIYIRVTDPTGLARINWHIVWDAEKFLAALQETWEKEGSTVSIASRDEYLESIRRSNG